MPNKQVIGIWGSSGSGKTLFSVQLAKALADKKQNVLLLSTDCHTPALPVLLPLEKREGRSLGRLWRMMSFSQNDILNHCVTFFGGRHFSVLGYDLDELPESYTSEMVEDLFILLRQIVDYIIVDCATDIKNNLLSTMALKNQAEAVIKVFNGDIRSLAQIRQLRRSFEEGPYFEQINVCNNAHSWQDIQKYYDGIGNILYTLPHVPDMESLYCFGKLGDRINGFEAREYEAVMERILKEVIEIE